MAGLRPLYWINQFVQGNLAIMGAPRLDDQFEATILAWRDEGVDVITSLIEDAELPYVNQAEKSLCEEAGIEFISFPVRDKTVPEDVAPFAAVARMLAERVSSGKGVAIHCRAGIGRSTTLAACVLILLGVEGDVALDMISAARGLEVPETEAQRQWVLTFSQLARPGSA